MAAGRARNRAEWGRQASDKRTKGPLEIDSDISQVSSKLSTEEKGIVRTALCGGKQAMKRISEYHQDYETCCNCSKMLHIHKIRIHCPLDAIRGVCRIRIVNTGLF